MNKTQLVEAIAAEANITKGERKRALEAFVKVTADVLSEGDKIALLGFGSFSVTRPSARAGRNLRVGAPIRIVSKNVVRFKPGEELCARVD